MQSINKEKHGEKNSIKCLINKEAWREKVQWKLEQVKVQQRVDGEDRKRGWSMLTKSRGKGKMHSLYYSLSYKANTI